MKTIFFLSFVFCATVLSMEIQQEVGEEVRTVPSLKLFAFNVVKQNLPRLGFKTDRCTNQIIDVIDSEMSNLSCFERAHLIDLFKVADRYEKVAKEVASYVDAHETPTARKVALKELQIFSTEMQRKISKYRQN